MATLQRIEFEAITPHVGAVAGGVDLREALDAETAAAIRQALLDRGVLFFRDQDITREQTAAFLANFGPLSTDPFSVAALAPPAPEHSVHDMPTYGNSKATAIWHMDSTLAPAPASFLTLRALELPPGGGGDTCWGSMYAAYETLSGPVRAMIDGLQAEHSAYKTLPLLGGSNTGYLQEEMRNVHPVVRVHPETGRKALFVNELWTESIVGVTALREPVPARACCGSTPSARNSPCAGNGGRTISPCGTTWPSSTMRCATTRATGCCRRATSRASLRWGRKRHRRFDRLPCSQDFSGRFPQLL